MPHAGHDPVLDECLRHAVDFNSRAPCGARHGHSRRRPADRNFNSRAPCGARPSFENMVFSSSVFQLTCPMRGTTMRKVCHGSYPDISTHVPHAGHDPSGSCSRRRYTHFNSRAPCGARLSMYVCDFSAFPFQLTCPMRGTTVDGYRLSYVNGISTHVPHAGHDCTGCRSDSTPAHFNSRAPCGARRARSFATT